MSFGQLPWLIAPIADQAIATPVVSPILRPVRQQMAFAKMIRFQLACDNNHQFESWFASNAAFDSLVTRGLVACAQCGSTTIEKSLMAPVVRTAEKSARPLASEKTEIEKLRDHVETTSDYVGLQFAAQARAMHNGDTPERPIYGEARRDEAVKLIEDGIPVMPLPFIPRKQAN